jgi:hypothetical protein
VAGARSPGKNCHIKTIGWSNPVCQFSQSWMEALAEKT